ncbi:MAG: magnesium transporter [Planctomycetaceae bacterium]|nr:magnesium transporter [Planctomycetaceae bacterium]
MASIAEINSNDPVTRHMRKELAKLRVGQTVREAIATLRQAPPPPRIVYFYVVDDDERLRGVIPSRALLLSPPDTPLADIMLRKVIAVPAEATVLDACEFFVLHRFLAFPVVDPQGRLQGAIDVELYTDELRDLGNGLSDDLFQLIGVHLARARQPGPIAAFRGRFPWLLCNVGGGIAAAFLAGIFRNQLKSAVALALFIPVVLALAESVSIQSISLTLQLLHGSPPSWAAIFRKLRRELLTGIMLGCAAGALVGLAALGWFWQPRLAACIVGGIASGVSAAAVFGAALPSLFHRFRLNPHLAAGPVVLAVSDIITLFCYFTLATWLLR